MEISLLREQRYAKIQKLQELNSEFEKTAQANKEFETIELKIGQAKKRVMDALTGLHLEFANSIDKTREKFLHTIGSFFESEARDYRKISKKFRKNESKIGSMKEVEQLLNPDFLSRFKCVESSIQNAKSRLQKFDIRRLERGFMSGKYSKIKKEYFKSLEKMLRYWVNRFSPSEMASEFKKGGERQGSNRDFKHGTGRTREKSRSRLYQQLVSEQNSKSFRGRSKSRNVSRTRGRDDDLGRSMSNSLVGKPGRDRSKSGYKPKRRAQRSVSKRNGNMSPMERSVDYRHNVQESSKFSINSALSKPKQGTSKASRSQLTENGASDHMRNTNSLIERKSANQQNRERNVNRRGREFPFKMGRTHSIDDLMRDNTGVDKRRLERDYNRKRRIDDKSEELIRRYNYHPSQTRQRMDFEEDSEEEDEYHNGGKQTSQYLKNDFAKENSQSGSFYNYEEDKDKKTNPSLKRNFMNSNISPVANMSLDNSKNKDWRSVEEVLSTSHAPVGNKVSKQVNWASIGYH